MGALPLLESEGGMRWEFLVLVWKKKNIFV